MALCPRLACRTASWRGTQQAGLLRQSSLKRLPCATLKQSSWSSSDVSKALKSLALRPGNGLLASTRGCFLAGSSRFTRAFARRSICCQVAAAEGAVAEVELSVATNEKQEGGVETKTERKKRVLSGVQPTGTIHLGNYLGAIKNWVKLQEEYDTYFCVVDLHAITLPQDPAELREATKKSAALYLACGIDPAKAAVFVQSHVTAHAELTWLLECCTPIGWLNRMIQFKEKSLKAGNEEVGSGLLVYPTLMAADILLYQADMVPVGEDQRQHLELTRDVATRFNNLYGGKKWKKRGGRGGRVFKIPDIMIPPMGARVMSLQDGTSKMSKSARSDMSRINLLDSPEEIANKVKRCKTDAFVGMEFDNDERPECRNLMAIYQLVSGQTKEEVVQECGAMNWGNFKPRLSDALVEHLRPIQERYNEVTADPSFLDNVLAEGAEVANKTARETLRNAYDAMGFLLPAHMR